MQKHHLQGKNIGLKHGIFKNIHPNYFKKNAHLDLVICGAKPEFEFIRDNFGYKESEVAYCGLARFDTLGTTDTFHQILIMPTFRIPLSGLSLDEFIKTEYYNKWLGFLQELDIKFGNLNGFKVIFYLHAVFQKYISAFKGKLKNIEIANFDDYDVLCHIDFAFKTAYLIDNSISIKEYEDYIIEIMKEIIKKDKTFELNVKVQSFLPVEHTKYLLKLYKDLGGKNVTLSSDAHKVNRLNDQFDKYIVLIKEAGFDHLNYFIKRNRYSISI